MSQRFSRRIVGLVCVVLLASGEAAAQLSGTPVDLPNRPSGRNSVAFDSVNKVYLVIRAGHPISGQFLDKNGVQIGGNFGIATVSDAPFTGWAGVFFGGPSSDPVFLVTYVTDEGSGNLHTKYGRLVRYVAGQAPHVGPKVKIADVGGEWPSAEKGRAAWNGASFVVGTRVPAGIFPQPQVALFEVNLSGGMVSSTRTLGDSLDYYGSPVVACVVNGACLLTGYANGIPFGGRGGTYARLFDGRTLAPLTGMFYLDDHTSRMEDQQAVYTAHTGQFLTAWWQANNVSTRRVTPNGEMGSVVTNTVGPAPVAGDLSLAYNAGSRNTLLASKAYGRDGVYGLYAVALGDDGAMLSGGLTLITSWDERWPEFTSAMAANDADAEWLVTAAQTNGGRAALIKATASLQPPAISVHPSSQIVHRGELVAFTAAAAGGSASITWQISSNKGNTWTHISGATSTTYAFWAAPRDTGKHFRAVFTNELGSATTNAAALRVTGMQTSDFDADGRGDLLVWRAASGTWHWAHSSFGFNDGDSKQFGNHGLGDVPLSGDMDGDGITDAIVWRAATGTWYWATSSSQYRDGGSRQWGNQGLGDVPILADMDGDGKSDLVVWRASTGTWYWVTSSSRFTTGFSKQWGNQSLGDVPLIGDFDGDGKADPAVWRASTGWWYWLTSSSRLTNGFMKQFGNSTLGDKPLVGDLDGDGTSDFSVWRASTGTWHWVTSSSGYIGGGFQQWGTLGDRPMLSDIDGDGMADLIVWRGSDGTWYWLNSSNRYDPGAAGSKQFGNQSFGDIPIIK